MFHYVRHVDKSQDELGYNLSIEATTFEEILKYLSDNGYQTIHIEDITDGSAPNKAIILTFDDGYKDFYTTAFPLLQKYDYTASVGVISGKMDGNQYMTPENVKEINDAGIEILSHTVHHLELPSTANAETEITESKKDLEELIGKPVTGFVYPAGKYDDESIKLLKEAGYKVALTTKPGYADLGGDLFQLHRVRIDNRDGLNGFIKKLTQN